MLQQYPSSCQYKTPTVDNRTNGDNADKRAKRKGHKGKKRQKKCCVRRQDVVDNRMFGEVNHTYHTEW